MQPVSIHIHNTSIRTVLIFSVNSNSKSSFLMVDFFLFSLALFRSQSIPYWHSIATVSLYFSSNYRNSWHFSCAWISNGTYFVTYVCVFFTLQFNINSIARCYAGVARDFSFQPFLRVRSSFLTEIVKSKKVFVFQFKINESTYFGWLLLLWRKRREKTEKKRMKSNFFSCSSYFSARIFNFGGKKIKQHTDRLLKMV